MAGLKTFEMLAERIADQRPDLADPAPTAHLVWAAMHGLVSSCTDAGAAPSSPTSGGGPEQH